MTKRRWLIALVALTLVLSLLAACGPAPTPTPSPAPTPTPSPAPTPAPKPTVLKLATYWYEEHPIGQGIKNYRDMVYERTNGLVDIKIFWQASLIPPKEEFDLVSAGTVDMVFVTSPTYFYSKMPSPSISTMFFAFGADPSYLEIEKDWRPLKDKDYQKHHIKLLTTVGPIPYCLFTNKEIKTREDLKGLLLRGAGGPLGDMGTAIGGEMVTMPAGEFYLALERGTADGGWFTARTYIVRKLYQWAPYILIDNAFTIGSIDLLMNLERFNELPQDLQRIMLECGDDAVGIQFNDMMMPEFESIMGDLREIEKEGLTTIKTLSDEERAEWGRACRPVWEKYIKDAGEIGRAGMDIIKKHIPASAAYLP